ncbi:MAG: RNase adapter RapZ [Lachnospiraceae bacterium]|nr:RNase adapter RapZ [Lachnospiraceae bacterium]
MHFVIVTGMSGAGKSTTLKMLEDAGYFCVDNLPIALIGKFAELTRQPNENITKVAIGIDIRSGNSLESFEGTLEELAAKHFEYDIVFLDASDDILIKRFKETRRNHPLSPTGRVEKGIEEERAKLEFLKKQADIILDTTNLLTRELKQELEKIVIKDGQFSNMMVTLLTFGYKYGIPNDADLVFDVRFLPNPYYVEGLKSLTGNDKEVRDYVMGFEVSKIFLDKMEDMLKFLIPNYILEGKNQLVICIGCTGGKHRSVTLANEIYKNFLNNELGYGIKVEHRDIERGRQGKK